MIKYALHPQIIHSKVDGETHYVGFFELIELYKLDYNDCVMWDDNRPETTKGRNFNDYIHLYPRADGNYKL